MISINQVTVTFGIFDLFKEISFLINPRDRIGLVGKNGAGKTTLLKIIAGLQQSDSGNVSKSSDVTIGYLPQQMNFTGNRTIMEEAATAFTEIMELEEEIKELHNQFEKRNDHESAEYMKMIQRLTEANERFELLGGVSIHAEIEKTLLGLGFTTTDFNRHTTELSGGWRMRVELAKILLKKPNLYLLDEPTNHLDIESIQWLEDYLKNYEGAVLLISHDRAFLDNITTRTVEISLGRIYDYKASYSKFVELRKERRETQLASFRNQQKLIEDTEDFIERFRYKATKAVQVQSRIKQLDKLNRIEVDDEDTSTIHIRFPNPVKSGKIVLELKGITKSYGEKQVLKGIDLFVESGERIAFVGKNGEGKSTLSKIIVGDLQHDGLLKIGYNVKIGYFAQNQDDLLNEDITVLDTIDRVAVGDIRSKIRDILGAFLFRGDDVFKKVKVLSGGERSRLAIAKLLFEPYNLLILDEPTNHLDMRSKDILKQALINYLGTLIIVSHDREFMEGLVTKIFEFRDKKIKEFIGTIYEFLQKKKMTSLKELEVKNIAVVKNPDERSVSENRQNYLEKKEYTKMLRKAENKVVETEKSIEQLEKEIEGLNQILSDPVKMEKIENKNAIFSMYEDLKKRLEKEMSNWEKDHKELEKLRQ